MKTSISVLAIALITVFTACNSAGTSSDTNSGIDTLSNQQAGLSYTCPMHPEVVSDKPGTCPKCKMDLVKEESTPGNDTTHGH